MIILYTRNNPASEAIAARLKTEHGFTQRTPSEWISKDGTLLIDTAAATVLEVPTDFSTDALIVLSTHRSKTPGKMLTTHVPGNWGDAEMGGNPKTLNIAPAALLKTMLVELKKEGDRIGWPVSLEADHHGPVSKLPLIFVEIGNGEEQWQDAAAADAVARAVVSALSRKPAERKDAAFAVGGGHYPRTFTKLVLETDIAIGHILPKYSIEKLDEDLFRQAIEKNVEKVSRVIVSKDETNSAQKEKMKALATKFDIPVEIV